MVKILVVVALAAGMGLGLFGLGVGLWGSPKRVGAAQGRAARRPRDVRAGTSSPGGALSGRIAMGIGAAGVVGAGTRWVAPAIFAGLAASVLPGQLARADTRRSIDKVEAIALWTELLRDTLAASAGLSQAIVAAASCAPAVIREDVARLAARLASGVSLESALRSFADDVDDVSVDMVVCALVLAARSRARRLVELLTALADATRDEVAMRLRIDASRSSARSSVRTVTIFSVVFAGVLLVVAHGYLSPFGSVTGQLVMCAVGLLYAAGLTLMVRMARPRAATRLLAPLAAP